MCYVVHVCMQMKEDCEALRRERDDLHADNAELRDKFSQKAMYECNYSDLFFILIRKDIGIGMIVAVNVYSKLKCYFNYY